MSISDYFCKDTLMFKDGEWVWDDMETAMAICRQRNIYISNLILFGSYARFSIFAYVSDSVLILREEELEHKHKMIKMQIDEDNAVLNAQDKLKDIEDDTDEIEEIMKKALANMQKTQELVNSISGIR